MTGSAVDIALITGRVMQKAEHETYVLVEALETAGVSVAVLPWDDATDWASVPLVVMRTPWDYFEHRDEFLSWAAAVDAVTRLVNPIEVLKWNSHKGYLLGLADVGVPVVPTTLVVLGASQADQRAALAGFASQEVVVKPAVSVGAIGALRGSADSATVVEHLGSLAAAGDVLVQPLERAVLTEGEISLIYFGGVYSHAVRKVPVPGEFRVNDHYGGAVVAHVATDAQRAAAEAALAAAPQSVSYARADLVRLDDPVVMELELIEPELFFHEDALAAARYAEHLIGHLAR